MRNYAQSHGLSISVLYSWKKTLRRKGVFDEHWPVNAPLFQKAAIVRESISQCVCSHYAPEQ
jgi:hypothetical protein